MLTLDFNLLNLRNAVPEHIDLVRASENELRFYCFHGDLVFVVSNCDFSARWGWLPALDLIIGLTNVGIQLYHGAETVYYEYTEAATGLIFKHRGEQVEISATYATGACLEELRCLLRQIGQFSIRILRMLEEAHPDLRHNEFMRVWQQENLTQLIRIEQASYASPPDPHPRVGPSETKNLDV